MKRRLDPDEAELWRTVARTVEPLHRPVVTAPPVPKSSDAKPPRKGAAAGPPTRAVPHAPPPPAALTRPQHRRLQRGRIEIEGRLDLHGLRQDEAFHRLADFLVRARSRGLRHVLVITGTGRPHAERPHDPAIDVLEERATRRGVLHRMVPQWLSTAPLRAHVAAWSPAAQRHGGDGALYVRLAS